jgi:glucuronate isomerase
MYRFLGNLYRRYGVVMQWHLAVYRNANSRMFEAIGPDCGGDCIGDTIRGSALISVLDAMERDGGVPQTILYCLNPAMNEQLATIAKAFPRVRLGTAWWFNDHKDGIAETMRVIARNGHLGSFLGMLTDSRSFLSYARHDYFRRILCTLLADWANSGEYSGDLVRLAEKICYQNIKNLIEETT